MALYKHSNRPDHDCIYHFNLRLAQIALLVFHQRGSEAIIFYDTMSASALHKVSLLQAKSCSRLGKTSLKFSKQINSDCRLDQKSCEAGDRKRRILSCLTCASEIHAAQTGNLERHEVLKQCRKCLRYSRTGGTCCDCGRICAGHHRRSSEVGRATNHQ